MAHQRHDIGVLVHPPRGTMLGIVVMGEHAPLVSSHPCTTPPLLRQTCPPVEY